MLLKSQSKGPMPNGTKVLKQFKGSWSTEETDLLEMLLREKREEKYHFFSLPPDLQSLTYASYWPNLSKCRSAGEPQKWSSLPTQRRAGNAFDSKADA